MAAVSDKKKTGFAGRSTKYFREVKAELKKVVWPKQNEVITSTMVVLATVVVIGTIIAGLDMVLSYLVRLATRG